MDTDNPDATQIDLLSRDTNIQPYFLGAHTRPISHEETIRLITLAKAGDADARNRIVMTNLRWVLRIAVRFTQKYSLIDRDDAVQVGVMAIIRSIGLFDVSRNYRFLTYAKGRS